MSKEEIEFDLSNIKISKEKVSIFFKKYGVVLLILIPLILSIYLRMIPSNIPMSDDWAKTSVENYYKTGIKDQIRQQYQNLPEQNLNTLTEQQYADFYKQNKAAVTQQIKQMSDQFKSYFQDENGYVYMPDIDPYTFLRYAQNYLNHGYIGDEIRNGQQIDNHMVAPKGMEIGNDPHPIVLAYLYKIMKIFNSKITLMQSSTYFPVIVSTLAIIPFFFMGSVFAGSLGGFFAALMMAINGAFLGRTTWGHADTDAYNIFFAAYFIWFFFLALKAKDTKKSLIYGTLAGLTIGLFSYFWSGWWYVFDFVLGTIGLYFLYLIIFENKLRLSAMKENKELKSFIIAMLILLAISGIFVSFFTSPKNFASSVFQPISFSTIKAASHASLWPNVYTTVAELNAASFSTIMNSVGGKSFFYLSLLGVLFLLLTKNEGRRENLPYAILIALWYIGIIYASTKGIRFTMMLVPPLSLGIGAAIGIGYKKTSEYLKSLGITPKITGAVFVIIFLLIFMPQIKGVANTVRQEVPMINDAWYNSLTKIKLESAPNAIINSWWDFGHHFKYFADRAVTFDGASQNSPMAHWIGKVLLTKNEDEAIGILRMLDCGSNDAFESLNELINDTPATVKLLYDLVVLDKSQAQSYLLNKGLSSEKTQEILKLTHCSPPEDYFITSADMVGKGAVWGHFGSWDFDRADIWMDARNLPREAALIHIEKQMRINEEEAKKIYYQVKSLATENDANSWIAAWPGYGNKYGCAKKDNNLICGGIVINLQTKDVQISTDKGVQTPNSIVYVENNNFVEKNFENGIGQSIILLGDGDSYNLILTSPVTATSMFTRLFFFNGIGLNHFTKFTEEMQPTGDKISIWKVKW